MTNAIEFINRIWAVVSDTALTTLMAFPFIVFAIVCGIIALVLWVRDSSRKRRAQREIDRLARERSRVRSMADHPAGKANQPRVLEATRHIDRPGYDWTSGIVPD